MCIYIYIYIYIYICIYIYIYIHIYIYIIQLYVVTHLPAEGCPSPPKPSLLQQQAWTVNDCLSHAKSMIIVRISINVYLCLYIYI